MAKPLKTAAAKAVAAGKTSSYPFAPHPTLGSNITPPPHGILAGGKRPLAEQIRRRRQRRRSWPGRRERCLHRCRRRLHGVAQHQSVRGRVGSVACLPVCHFKLSGRKSYRCCILQRCTGRLRGGRGGALGGLWAGQSATKIQTGRASKADLSLTHTH